MPRENNHIYFLYRALNVNLASEVKKLCQKYTSARAVLKKYLHSVQNLNWKFNIGRNLFERLAVRAPHPLYGAHDD